MIEIQDVIDWLAEEPKDASAVALLRECEFSYSYVDLTFPLSGGDQIVELYELNIHAPRKVFDSLNKYQEELTKIENSIRTLSSVSNQVYITNTNWVPLIQKESRTHLNEKNSYDSYIFNIPKQKAIEVDLVGLMMPFNEEFRSIHDEIKLVCRSLGLRCKRADDIWENPIVINDVFDLIYKAKILIFDITDHNPNVMYELGIAHTLGKRVMPISQSTEQIPFDIAHHKVLPYIKNQEGMTKLNKDLTRILSEKKDFVSSAF